MGLLDNGAQPWESSNITDIPRNYCFYKLFEGSKGITSVSEDFLPATVLYYNCYQNMFNNCTALTTAPKLPATTLWSTCYAYMFAGCTSLTKAPEICVTDLPENSCDSMFLGCTSLVTAPKMHATRVRYGSCMSMFAGCSSLTTAPELPATTLGYYCYKSMFESCTSLTKAPDLPATTLKPGCYTWMFLRCSSLKSIKIDYRGNFNYDNFPGWVDNVSGHGTFYYNGNQTARNFDFPKGWTTSEYDTSYMAIIANTNSTLTLNNKGGNNPDLQYSTDHTNWSAYNTTIDIPQGQRLYLKGNNPDGWSKSNTNYSYLSITGDVSISGNVMALLDNGTQTGESGDITDIPCNYCFYELFRESTGITGVSEDFLPATTLANHCYAHMFEKCTSLTTIPELPATTLTNHCYAHMFEKCTSLTTIPELPATSLENGCYRGMFENCTSLTTAPKLLPATTLADNCYGYMFYGCSSLTTAPELPATNLTNECYRGMFFNCSSLTTAPELPATTLADYCYDIMFYGCSSLNSIKISYTDDYNDIYFRSWVSGVADSGTFYYIGNQTAQDFKLPSGWRKV